MIWYTYQMENMLMSITEDHLTAYQIATNLETALVNQKGFVAYFYLDGDPDWLRQHTEYRKVFKKHLAEVKFHVGGERELKAVQKIEAAYELYVKNKDRVIEYYKTGNRERGAKLHRMVRDRFFTVLSLCEQYKDLHANIIFQAKKDAASQAEKLRYIAIIAGVISLFLAIMLIFHLIANILNPVRRLIIDAGKGKDSQFTKDEISVLEKKVYGLLEDVDHTHHELEKSREHLLQSEKLALVGKLAAGMAHSLRNPFTSVKMRMFSLGRSLKLTPTQKEDFEVITEEIQHINTIIQNFLEFSRPPKLKMQPISPSMVVDSVIQLLEHRLKSYNTRIIIKRSESLPDIQGDPEQLKEVLVNIIINACEAIGSGGQIDIQEEELNDNQYGRASVITISDNGPGLSETIKDKIFQPFYTTKEEGTGLGLSIASRIINEHHGKLEVESQEGKGTKFIITLRVKE